MRAIVCGGRDFTDRVTAFSALDRIHEETPITLLIEGGAKGADRLAREWARGKGIKVRTVMANWLQYGKAAGVLRNSWMLELHPDFVVAFPGGNGTADMVAKTRRAGVKLTAVKISDSGSWMLEDIQPLTAA